MSRLEFDDVEAVVGYAFRDRRLLETALTHASYVHEHGGESYERLEFLGDSILNFLVSEALFGKSGADEGKLTVLRAQTVSKKPLSEAVQRLGLAGYLRLGSGATGEDLSDKLVSDLFEAVVGAIYVDSGSLEPCRRFVFRNLKGGGETDYKTLLQNAVQERGVELPQYRCEPDPNGGFVCRVSVDGKTCGTGTGGRKKQAEQQAAREAIEKLGYSD